MYSYICSNVHTNVLLHLQQCTPTYSYICSNVHQCTHQCTPTSAAVYTNILLHLQQCTPMYTPMYSYICSPSRICCASFSGAQPSPLLGGPASPALCELLSLPVSCRPSTLVLVKQLKCPTPNSRHKANQSLELTSVQHGVLNLTLCHLRREFAGRGRVQEACAGAEGDGGRRG